MTVPTVNVTLTVCDQTGATVPNATVTAQLTALDLYNASYVFPTVQTFTTDVNGLVTMPIFPNALGQKNTRYQIRAIHPSTGKALVNVTVFVPNFNCDVSAIVGNNPSSQPYPLPSVQPYSSILTQIASGIKVISASLILFLQSGIGAVSTDLQSKVRNIEVSAWDGMSAEQKADVAARTALVDVADSINAAIVAVQAVGGYEVQLPHGKLLIGSKIIVPASIALVGHSRGTTIVKGFNGDMVDVASSGSLRSVDLDGNSGSYSGRGVIITSGVSPTNGKQFFFDVHISNTRGYNVEYTADGVGFDSHWLSCTFSIPSNDIYCIKLPVDTGVGNRHFTDCHAPADSLMDLNGSGNTNLNGCFSGRSSAGGLWCLGFADTSAQAVINGCRLAGGGQTAIIKGTLHVISGGSIAASGITFAAGATKCIVKTNPTGALTWTDSSASSGVNANEFDVNVTVYAPTWTGGAPAIGNGNIVGSYVRDGRKVHLSFELNYGTTSTPGVGAWSFSIPFKAGSRRHCGAALIKDASDTFYTATAIIEEDASTVQIYPHGKFAAIQDGVPFTWANGDKLNVTIEYFA